MHTCIHAYMHAYIHTYIHTYIHVYRYMYVYIFLLLGMFLFEFAFICILTYAPILITIPIDVHMYTHDYMQSKRIVSSHIQRIHVCICMYVYLQTCMHVCMRACVYMYTHTRKPGRNVPRLEQRWGRQTEMSFQVLAVSVGSRCRNG